MNFFRRGGTQPFQALLSKERDESDALELRQGTNWVPGATLLSLMARMLTEPPGTLAAARWMDGLSPAPQR